MNTTSNFEFLPLLSYQITPKIAHNMSNFSIFDQLEGARVSFQELDDKFLDLQKMLLKIKKKNVK